MSTRETGTDKPILVFGAAGQVGRELLALAATRGVPAVGVTRADADIADAEAVAALLARHEPRLVVNAAAYTAVDKAEGKPDAARRGNVEGPRVLAEATAAAGVPILHLSTDNVFDGSKVGAYIARYAPGRPSTVVQRGIPSTFVELPKRMGALSLAFFDWLVHSASAWRSPLKTSPLDHTIGVPSLAQTMNR